MKALPKVREQFCYVNCSKDAKEWFRKCEMFSTSNGPQWKLRALMRQYNVRDTCERIALHISRPYPELELGNRYISVVIDYSAMSMEAYDIPNQEASTI